MVEVLAVEMPQHHKHLVEQEVQVVVDQQIQEMLVLLEQVIDLPLRVLHKETMEVNHLLILPLLQALVVVELVVLEVIHHQVMLVMEVMV